MRWLPQIATGITGTPVSRERLAMPRISARTV
jgi:hypothetical protein